MLRERGPRTQVIDLAGKTVMPGLIDSHVHALSAGLSEFREPLPPLDSFAAIRSFIRAKAAKTPKGEWIVVPRTFPTRLAEMRMPTRETLDVDRDHPVMFDASYTVVVNSAALTLSGITRETPNPPRGEIVKDHGSEPNGILKNGISLLKGLKQDEGFSETEKLQAARADAAPISGRRPHVGVRPRRGLGTDRALPQAAVSKIACRSAS